MRTAISAGGPENDRPFRGETRASRASERRTRVSRATEARRNLPRLPDWVAARLPLVGPEPRARQPSLLMRRLSSLLGLTRRDQS